MKETYKVYCHTSPSGKKYIGITKREPTIRWGKNGIHYKSSCIFYKAIQKYGWENIKHEILFENLTKEEAEAKEIELIAFYKSNQREYGYNLDNGGNHIGKFSEQTRAKISISKIGKTHSEATKRKLSEHNKGRKLSEDVKKRLSEQRKGVPKSEETKAKMSLYAKNRPKSHLEKLSIANKGKKASVETRLKISKPILQFEANGNLVGRFNSARQANSETGVPYKQISACCTGRQKSAHGYIWKYETNLR